MTTPTLADVLGYLQAAGAAVGDIQYAPPYPPEQIGGAFPFWVVYPDRFRSVMNTTEDFKTLWDIRCEMHLARNDLSAEVEQLLPYAETILNALYGALKTNAVAHEGIDGNFGALPWEGPASNIGWLWTVKAAKVITPIT